MSDLSFLIEHAIPEGRQSLESGYTNLERIAAYCEANYIQATDKRSALEETKRLTVQSLASVAYQINALASNVITMLDLQTDRVSDMETQLNNITQIVDIHKEKVSRREIGVLTTNKIKTRQHKIIEPLQQEKQQSYIRRNIDYSILDDLGHGVKLPNTQNQRTVNRAGSTVSSGPHSAGIMMNDPSGPIYLSAGLKTGTISRSTLNKEYRTPVTVAPPTAPMIQGAEYVQQRYPGLVQTNQSNNMIPTQYRTGTMDSHQDNYGAYQAVTNTVYSSSSAISRQSSQQQHQRSLLEECALQLPGHDFGYSQEPSPPLPPPPMDFDNDNFRHHENSPYNDNNSLGIIQSSGDGSKDEQLSESSNVWIPQCYVEKVIALYDYQAEKSDELSFYENQVIYVLKKNEDGWFEGVLDGMTGLFPGNYVEPCL